MLVRNLRRQYLTIIDKPISSLSLLALVDASAELMYAGYVEASLSPMLSVLVGAITFKTLNHLFCAFIKDTKFRKSNVYMNQLINKIFLVDLQRDSHFYVQFYQFQQYFRNFHKHSTNSIKVTTAQLSSEAISEAGCHSIITRPEFQPFCNKSSIILSSYDPYYGLSIACMLTTYILIRGSRHPFLIHMTRENNKLYCWNLAFMMGLGFAAVPAIYPLAYLGLISTHIVFRKVGKVFDFKWEKPQYPNEDTIILPKSIDEQLEESKFIDTERNSSEKWFKVSEYQEIRDSQAKKYRSSEESSEPK